MYKFNIIDFWLNGIKVIVYDLKHTPKDAFKETGIIFYEGMQGSGKTISMIHDVMILQKQYPKCKVIDNLNYQFSDGEMNNPNDLIDFNNGYYGVISAIDECAIWFNNRNFKEFSSNSNMLQIIFENRKCRRLLLGTTQKFNLVDKNLRIQTNLIRTCRTLFGVYTFYIEKIPIFDSEGNVVKYQFRRIKGFVHTLDVRNAYDTYHVIKKFKVDDS